MRMLLIGITLMTALVALGAQTREPRDDPNSGPYLYRTHCVSCHGNGGRGDGPAVKALQVAPPDLTTIAERHAGRYPSDDIAQIIDGRRPLPGHTRNDMPLWGVVLGNMEMRNEVAVKARVEALVAHIETLQKNRPR